MLKALVTSLATLCITGCGDSIGNQIEKCVQAGVKADLERAKAAEQRNIDKLGKDWKTSPKSQAGENFFSQYDKPEYVATEAEIEKRNRLVCLQVASGKQNQ